MKLNLLLLVGAVFTLIGCSSPLLRPVTSAIFSGGGATVGSVSSHGNPIWAAGGAVAGAAVSEALFYAKTKSEQRAYQTGYQQALSDQMKSQYWQQQFRHWPASSPTMQLPVPLPERVTPDGVRLVPSTEFVPIRQ